MSYFTNSLAGFKPVKVGGYVNNFYGCCSEDDVVDAMKYCYNDIITTRQYGRSMMTNMQLKVDIPNMIDRVIFNDPATIIYWADGSKTVVKRSEDDEWDPEKGFCMAVIKKLYGRTSFIKNYIESDEEMPILTVEEACENLKDFGDRLKSLNNIKKGEK